MALQPIRGMGDLREGRLEAVMTEWSAPDRAQYRHPSGRTETIKVTVLTSGSPVSEHAAPWLS